MMREEPERWAGRIGCEIALALLTGGAASKRIADLIADSDKLADFARRFGGRDRDRNRDRDGDDDRLGVCRSSFPTGTLVLGADGTTRAIEDIRVGEKVLAFDPTTASWTPRKVTAQWSYLDTDEMASASLVDGSAITATDPHRFYDVGDVRFEELEDLSPGDLLATPAGTVEVAEVDTWPSGPTLVWELTVAVDHTFAVLAGEHPVAVHNQECTPSFIPPTNPPQIPPTNVPQGHSVRVMPATTQYPNGYWVQTNGGGQPVDSRPGSLPRTSRDLRPDHALVYLCPSERSE